METIYKGAVYNGFTVESEIRLDTVQCNLFNVACKYRVQLKVVETDGATGYAYSLSIGKAATDNAPTGVYDLELFGADGSMASYVKNFAKIVPTSKQPD